MKYKSYLSFGFNCEVGFALQYLDIFTPTLFSWADVRGTTALLFGIKYSDHLLSGAVTNYANDMFFCELSKIGFHGKVPFNEALDSSGKLDATVIDISLNETRSRITHLEEKQKQAFENGRVLVIVKYVTDIFDEPCEMKESIRLVRAAISEKYNTSDFEILYVTTDEVDKDLHNHNGNYIRTISKFSSRSNAADIDKRGWEMIIREFLNPKDDTLSAPLRIAAKYWSEHQHSGRTRWWLEPTIVNHVNKLICGEPVHGASAGIMRRLGAISKGKAFKKGISVACGNGAKELQLIKEGLVERFTLYEISETRVEQGIQLAYKLGLQDKVEYHLGDAFNADLGIDFDLIYWDSALHHMLDAHAAVKWSHDRLASNGCFFMHDYVGASRFQWSDFQCMVATRVRQLLPDRLLLDPNSTGKKLAKHVLRPDASVLITMDPTEAADSANIIPAIKAYFPDAEITFTGGSIYHTALNDVMANFNEEDETLLSSLLLLDETLIASGEYHFAVASARKW